MQDNTLTSHREFLQVVRLAGPLQCRARTLITSIAAYSATQAMLDIRRKQTVVVVGISTPRAATSFPFAASQMLCPRRQLLDSGQPRWRGFLGRAASPCRARADSARPGFWPGVTASMSTKMMRRTSGRYTAHPPHRIVPLLSICKSD